MIETLIGSLVVFLLAGASLALEMLYVLAASRG